MLFITFHEMYLNILILQYMLNRVHFRSYKNVYHGDLNHYHPAKNTFLNLQVV